MNIYEHNTAQGVVLSYIDEQKIKGNLLTQQKVAEELRVQKSYFSRFMKQNALLSRDQGYLLGKLLKLNPSECDYLLLLIDRDKAAVKEYRDELSKKIKRLQSSNTISSSYLEKETMDLSDSEKQKYYMSTEAQLIHLALSIKKYQEAPSLLKDIFQLSQTKLNEILDLLESLKLIEVNKNQVVFIRSNMHLPKDSPLFHSWQSQVKLKSLEWGKKLEEDEKYNFCVSFTGEEKDRQKIYFEFMKFLKKVELVVKNSKSKNLYQMNFDLFKWL